MAASILAASVQSAFQAWAAEHFPPDRVCQRLNDLVHRRTAPEKFVTFFATLYDPETGSVVYSNAGHNPGVVLRAGGGHELLPAQGPPLGLFPGQTYGSGSLTLEPGDLLLLYTDGITEAANPDDDEFGLDRLIALAAASRRSRSPTSRKPSAWDWRPLPPVFRSTTTGPSSSCGGCSLRVRHRKGSEPLRAERRSQQDGVQEDDLRALPDAPEDRVGGEADDAPPARLLELDDRGPFPALESLLPAEAERSGSSGATVTTFAFAAGRRSGGSPSTTRNAGEAARPKKERVTGMDWV